VSEAPLPDIVPDSELRIRKANLGQHNVGRIPRNAKYNNPRLLARVVQYARKGCSRSDSFKLVGVHADTGFDWLRYARTAPEKYPLLVRFTRALEKAEALFNKELVEVVHGHAVSKAPNTWQAGMTMLERRDPKNWGKRDSTKVEVHADQPLVQLNQVVLVDDDARDLSRELLRRVSAGAITDSAHEPLGPGIRGELEAGDEPE
jgi:hypothetical protein